jgi:hypothetical protein
MDGWQVLCKGGKNGFFIIVMCLAWWVDLSETAGNDGHDDLMAMLDDVHWALQKMVARVQRGETESTRDESPALVDRSTRTTSKRRAAEPTPVQSKFAQRKR